MDINDFKSLKEKIKTAKEKKIRAEGAMDQILKTLKDEFKVNSIEEAEKKLASMKDDLEKDEEKLDEMMDKLEKMVDWDKI